MMSSACWAPVVMMTSAGSTPSMPWSRTSSVTRRRVSSLPSVLPYCRAASPSLVMAAAATWATWSSGKTEMSGMPPERLMMSLRLAAAKRSRTALALMVSRRRA